jgi:hypothetical protein
MKEIQGAKDAAMQASQRTPTMDMIQQLITQTIEQERTLKLRPEELDQRIKEAIAKEKTGITKEAVEMSKIDKQYELDKMKLQSDSEKPGQWIDGIKDIAQSAAAVIGDRMGQAMAVKPPMPQTPMPSNLPAEQPIDDEQSMMKTCPACNKNLLMNLPPGSVGQCPHCGTPLQVTANSGLSVLDMSQPIPQQRPPAPAPVKPMPTQEQPAKKINGDTLGNCVSCGRTLYPWNIAATDDQGNKWCKNCQGAQKDGLSQ